MKKGFLAGFLTALIVVSLVGTAAATSGKVQKELEYRDISVSLDGEKLDLKDAKGNTVEPFMFEGTNYLPVRALAEALGLTVAWDGNTNTVVLTSPKEETAEDPVTTTQEDKLLFSKNHIRLYFVNITASDNGDYVANLRLENDSDYTIYLKARDVSVGGKEVTPQVSGTAQPGRTADVTLTFTKDALQTAGIQSVSKAHARFWVCSNGYTVQSDVMFESESFVLG